MALIDKKLTDLTEKLSVPDDAFIHIVDVSDTSQSPDGSSYKARKSTISGTVKAQTGVSGTVKTNTNSADPIVYLKSEVDALVTGKQDALGFTPENLANKQTNLDEDLSGNKYPNVTAVRNGLSDKASLSDLFLKADKSSTYTKAEVDNIISSLEFQDVIEADSFALLPLVGESEKIYITLDTNLLYRFNGTIYVPLSADVSGKEDIANKQNSLAVDATNLKYPTVTAVNAGLATKQNTISGTTNVVPKFGTGGLVNTTISEDANGVLIQGNYVGANIAPLVVKNNTPYGSPFTQMIALFQNSAGVNMLQLRADGLSTFQSFASMASLSIRDLGTAATASIRLGNVNGTGLFSPSANAIGFTAGGTEAGRIHTSRRWSFGSQTDDGTNLAQFNGTISVATATQPNQAPRLEQVIQNNGILEFNTTDRTVWNNGKGNLSSNTSFGESSLSSNTTGENNTSVGRGSLISNTTGSNNTTVGKDVLSGGGASSNNTAIGNSVLSILNNGSNNVAIGNLAGRFDNIGDGQGHNNSVLIGAEGKLTRNATNEIAIGYQVQGNGDNSVTIGNSSVTKTILRGTVEASNATANNQLPTLGQIKSRDGWASYSTTTYTNASPFTVAPNTTVTLPNNANNSITTDLPLGVTAFYNGTTNKITPAAIGDAYTVNVRFKARTTMNNDYLTLFIDIGAGTQINAEAKQFLKGANTEQPFSFTMPIFTLATFVANGGEIKVASNGGTISIYDVTFYINRNYTR